MLSPDIGVSEMLVIAAVALIVVGPKDLPLLMRRVGQFIAKLRGMASEFRASFEDMARQSELEELRKEVEAMRSGQYIAPLQDASVDQVFADIDSGLKTGQVSFSPAMSIGSPVEAAVDAAEPAAKPARKPRAKPASTVAVAIEAPAKPVRRARTRKSIVEGGETTGGIVEGSTRKRPKAGTVS